MTNKFDWASRSIKLVMATLVLVTSSTPVSPASAEAVYVGACYVHLVATLSPAATPVPVSWERISLSDSGHSFCETNLGETTVEISGVLETPPLTGSWGCLSGVADGSLTVAIDLPGFPNPTVDAIVVNHAGVLDLVMTSESIVFDGVATLVQGLFSNALCAAGESIDHASWFGVMAFQDPSDTS